MAEEQVVIDGADGRIEGLYHDAPGEKAVVVTHPHPLYGGSMHNNVVEAVIQAYGESEYATLRFNFRGVGGSEGVYGEGIGEQNDVNAALNHLVSRGKSLIDLAGYSFGAWVNALGIERFASARRLVMVSPPVNFIDFNFLRMNPKIQLVIAGSVDDIGPPAMIREMLPRWNPKAQLEIVQGADHFYSGKKSKIINIISEFINKYE